MAPGPTLPAALAFLFGAFFFERLSGQTGFDPDGFHQMALFREWLRTGTLPLHDTFAFTHTVVPAVQHEWGAGALLYGIATTVGAPGIMWVRWLISAAAALVAARAARRRAPAVVVAFCAPFAIILAQVGFTTIRAGLYTMLFLAVLLAAIERDRDQPRAGRFLLVYLPVVALWINLHGGWIVGVAAVALHLVEQTLRRRPIRHLVLALAATPLLMGLTPYGRAYFTGWWRSITFPRDQIAEWLPLYRSSYLLGLAAFGLAMLFLIYAVARRGPRRLPGLAFVVVAAWAAWRHERHVALFALAWFCAVPGYLAATPLGELLEAAVARRPFARALSFASIAVGVALLVVAAPRHPFRLRVPAQGSDLAAGGVVYPAGAVAYLAGANFHGRLVTSFINGGFVIWRLFPAARVSFDGRYEVAYAPEVLDEDRRIHRARPGWSAIVARYAPDAMLVARNEPLAAALPDTSGLARVYRDDAYEVWARPALGLPAVDRTGAVIPSPFP
ncbi:MAG TPA: hypothetical protein VH853_12430 [Polyangia bacterium]|nr:hypothetical protein [Polyangia bacterium]